MSVLSFFCKYPDGKFKNDTYLLNGSFNFNSIYDFSSKYYTMKDSGIINSIHFRLHGGLYIISLGSKVILF